LSELIQNLLIESGFYASKEDAFRVAERLAAERDVETEVKWSAVDNAWEVGVVEYQMVDSIKEHNKWVMQRYGNPFDLVNDHANQAISAAARRFNEENTVIPPTGKTSFTINKKERLKRQEWYEQESSYWKCADLLGFNEHGLTFEQKLARANKAQAIVKAKQKEMEFSDDPLNFDDDFDPARVELRFYLRGWWWEIERATWPIVKTLDREAKRIEKEKRKNERWFRRWR